MKILNFGQIKPSYIFATHLLHEKLLLMSCLAVKFC